MNQLSAHQILLILTLILANLNVAKSQDRPGLTLQMGHTNYVSKMLVSDDGEYLLTIDGSENVKLWNVKTTRLIRTFRDLSPERDTLKSSDRGVSSIHYHEGSKLLAVGYDSGIINIWKISSSNLRNTINTNKAGSSIHALCFTNDGEGLLSAQGFETKITYWDVKTGKLNKTINIHEKDQKKILSINVLPSSSQVVSTSKKKMILWDLNTEQIRSEWQISPAYSFDLSFSKKGEKVVINNRSAYKDDELSIIDLKTDNISTLANVNKIRNVSISNDGKYVYTTSGIDENILQIFDVESKQVIKNFELESLSGEFLPNSNYLILGQKFGSVSVNDWRNEQYLREFGSDVSRVNSISIAPSGKIVAGGDELNVWNLMNFTRERNLWNKRNYFYDTQISTNGNVSLATTAFGSTALFDNKTGEVMKVYKGHEKKVLAGTFTNDYKHIITGGEDDKLIIFDIKTKNIISTISDNRSDIKDIFLTQDGKKVIYSEMFGSLLNLKSALKVVDISNITSPEIVSTPNLSSLGWIKAMALHPGKNQILTYNDSQKGSEFSVIDLDTYSVVKTFHTENNSINSIAFDINGDRFITGGLAGDVIIWDLQTGKPIKKLKGHSSKVTDVKFGPTDDNLAFSASTDGAIKMYNTLTGEEIVQMMAFDNEDSWFVFSPDGYYTAQKAAVGGIHYVSGLNVLSFEQFDLRFNRPDKLFERFGKVSQEFILPYKKAWEKRVRKMGFEPEQIENGTGFHTPNIKLVLDNDYRYEVKKQSLSIKFEALDTLFNLDRVFIDVNGVPTFGYKGKSIDIQPNQVFSGNERIKLSDGENNIKISVMNSVGIESSREEINVIYSPLEKTQSNLHLIAIGVSDFQQSEFNLTYANKDANDISQTFSSNSGGFDNITVHTLTNQKATRENVLALRKELENTKVDDEVIVFVASHGLLDEELDYYLAMHDTDFANPKDGGLRYDELEALIDGIPARNKAMFIDACHSGEVDKEESELVAANDVSTGTVKSRGFKRVTTKASNSGIGLKTSFELMKELFADLRRNNGAIVISSASGQEYAFESSEWKNGVFTYSLLEGLKSGNADLNKDGEIVVSEIRDYVSKRVQELTNGKQNPTSRTENLENDFRVW